MSNLFGVATGNEPASVQHGTISVRTRLEARRGVFETPYHGPVYVLDVVTNNPGAAGGALVTRRGELLGMLGKELRNALEQHLAELRRADRASSASRWSEIRAGQVRRPQGRRGGQEAGPGADAWRCWGSSLVPDVVERTPPYVDQSSPARPPPRPASGPTTWWSRGRSPRASRARPCAASWQYIDFEDQVKLTVLRGQEHVEFAASRRRRKRDAVMER